MLVVVLSWELGGLTSAGINQTERMPFMNEQDLERALFYVPRSNYLLYDGMYWAVAWVVERTVRGFGQ